MFLKKKQPTPHYEEEEELNDDQLNALYEEEPKSKQQQQQYMEEDDEEESIEQDDEDEATEVAVEEEEEDEEESSSEDEKILSFAERLALNNMKSSINNNKSSSSNNNNNQKNNKNRNNKHHTPKKVVERDGKTATVIERKNKNAPKEVSSKIRPKTIPDIAKRLGYVKKKSRDPRFDPTATSTDPASFKQFSGHYRHVFDQLKDEIDENREKLRDKSLSYEERNDIQREISRLQTRNKKFETQTAIAEVKDKFYRREKKLISEKGKQAYFLKDSDVKKILKERKVEGIKKSGKMNKYLKKTKLKDKSKVASLMPTKRRE